MANDDLPCTPITAAVRERGTWLVGGTRGLFIGAPGNWRPVSDQAVRTIAKAGGSTWILYGNGAVDRMEIGQDRLFPDVLEGAAKRPWSSAILVSGSKIVFGGFGGWAVKSKLGFEEFYPKEMEGHSVTAICPVGNELWLGTQDGLFRIERRGKVVRYGLASGLPDPWVTAILEDHGSVLVGTASAGLIRLRSGVFEPEESPTKQVRTLDRLGSSIVLGGLDGVWAVGGGHWTRVTQ